ncbi:MAG: DUF4838 domain-containing protein [Verrucomicrobiales bacterium]|nr:DUF4838 domain-containing protein [Verrucomicrobiales bacterium]
MKLVPLAIGLLALLIASAAAPAIAAPFLIENGQPQAVIITAEEPTRSARLAATELQTYLEKISGARLEIVTTPSAELPLRIFVGESDPAREAGVTSDGLTRDAFRVQSGPDWLALVGNDLDFEPIEPWARHHSQWASEKQAEWEKLAGHPWMNPIGASLYRSHSRELGMWTFDHRGSLNAVYAFLRDLGVRWYMPGELGEIVPTSKSVVLPEVDRTVIPEFEIRSIGRPLLSSQEIDDAMWYLRIGANHLYSVLHHGQRYLTEHPEQRAKNPEYYGMLADGTRDTQRKTATACLSSEGFFEEMVAFARLMFDHYEVPVVSVMPHDGFRHCQCEVCLPQMTPERGPSGSSSDYVWDFVVRVADELAETHPDLKVFCGAYSTYRLPPLTINKLPDNVWTQITNGRPIREMDDAVHEEAARLRAEWAEKTNNPLSVTLNYSPFTNRGAFRPQYWPHVAARGIQDSHDEVWREDVWPSTGKGGLHHPAMAHLNPWVISRFWWNADQDIDVLLDEYYELFYGPAAAEMKTFIEYCEVEFARLASDAEVSRTALELFDASLAKAPADSPFGQRLALVDEFLTTFRARAAQIGIERPEGLPHHRIIDMSSDKWRDARDTLTMDGQLEEPFWTAYNYPRPLRDARTGRSPAAQTRFHVRWLNDSLYFGIHCELPDGETPAVGSTESGAPAIFEGEHLELLIETDKHSYYQIALNPAGEILDLDRGADEKNRDDWSSEAEIATYVGEGFWSAELRFPVTASQEDPLHQIVGSRPFQSRQRDLDSGKGTSLPWHFNLVRKRGGSEGEMTAFAPLGEGEETFYTPLWFAKIYVQ